MGHAELINFDGGAYSPDVYCLARHKTQASLLIFTLHGGGGNCDVNGFTETDFIKNFKMSRYRQHLSAPLHKTLTARHSSEATHLSEEVRCCWPVLVGNRRRYVPVTDPFYNYCHHRSRPCLSCRF